jgi:two-component system sensor histidine kinase KdpD
VAGAAERQLATQHDGRRVLLGATVHIQVVDYGPGLSTDQRERVFLPFQRSGNQNGPPGIGLGLALSQGTAEAMGGSLEAEDTPGGGLTMDLTLPTAPTREPAAEATEGAIG